MRVLHGLALSASLAVLGAPGALADSFTLLVHEHPAEFALRSDPSPAGRAYWDAYAAVGRAMADAGILRGGTVFAGHGASRSIGAAEVPGGGGLELGGQFVIEVADLETAVAWASRLPAARTGRVEVRPHAAAPAM